MNIPGAGWLNGRTGCARLATARYESSSSLAALPNPSCGLRSVARKTECTQTALNLQNLPNTCKGKGCYPSQIFRAMAFRVNQSFAKQNNAWQAFVRDDRGGRRDLMTLG
jgi:hypothetical protein